MKVIEIILPPEHLYADAEQLQNWLVSEGVPVYGVGIGRGGSVAKIDTDDATDPVAVQQLVNAGVTLQPTDQQSRTEFLRTNVKPILQALWQKGQAQGWNALTDQEKMNLLFANEIYSLRDTME